MSNQSKHGGDSVLQARQADLTALSDELMRLLDQMKALLIPLNKDSFFDHPEGVLQNYFYAIETLVDLAIHTRDDLSQIILGAKAL